MPRPERQVISITTGTIVRAVLVLVAVGVLWLIRDILLLVFTALLLAGVMYPVVRWAATYRIPKGLTVAAFYLVLFGLAALAFVLLIPALLDQFNLLMASSDAYTRWFADIFNWLRDLSTHYGLNANLKSGLNDLPGQIQDAFGGVLNLLTGVFGGIAGSIIILVLAAYMITQERAARNLFKNIVPNEYQEFAAQLVWQVIDRLGGWLRGQIFLGLVIGLLYFIGYSAIGMPYALLLAVLGGLLEFIPYFGPILSAVPAVLLAFTLSPGRAIAALIIIVVIQELEGHFIVPKVMQKAAGLNPIASIIALLIGAKLFGVIGALFAIPVATAMSVVISEYLRFRARKNS